MRVNRLAPLIRRRTYQAATFEFPPPLANVDLEQAAAWLEDAKLFAFGWVAGLVVFGTLIA